MAAVHASSRAGREAQAGGEIRPFGAEDTLAVADMFQRVFLRRAGPASPALAAYFVEIFLDHPWFDLELPSRVYVGPDGRIRGFIGTMPLRLSFRGRLMRAAVASSLMVEGADEHPLAGARLLRAFFQGPQDLSLAETAAPMVRQMWITLGGQSLPAYSMEWVRVLQPVGFGICLGAERLPLLRLLRLPAAVVDPLLSRLTREPLRAPPPPVVPGAAAAGADVAQEELASFIPHAIADFALRPVFDAAILRWLLTHAAQKEVLGAPVARIVRGRDGRPVGGYLAHFRSPRGVFRVMQVFAAPAHAATVVDDVLAHAWQLGAVAVIGRNQPELMDALLARRCLFWRTAAMLAHAPRSPELVDTIRQANAFVNGLAGETWARLIGGRFD